MAKGAFVQRGLMILVCVARFTQVVAMEDGKSSARVHPTPDKYGTQQVQISMVIAYIEMIAMRQISCNEGCMDAKTCFEGNLERKNRIAAEKRIVFLTRLGQQRGLTCRKPPAPSGSGTR